MKKTLFYSFLFLLISFKIQAQSIYAGADTTICSGNTIDLVATFLPQAAIAFDPDVVAYTTGIPVSFPGNQDDYYSAVLPLGFDFCFFGATYNRFVIGTNNVLTFDTTYALQASGYVTIPIPNPSAPLNAIMGPWQDIHPGLAVAPGGVSYKVFGTAPFRHLTVSWYQIPMFQCETYHYTSQIKIYESTGVIESHILERQICTWNDGNAVHGLHNFDGTIADVVPGRNNTAFNVSNEGYRWTPQVTNPIIQWFDMAGTLLNTGTNLSVTPSVTTSYVCKFTGNTCGLFEITDTVTINVIPSLDASFTYASSTYCPSGGSNPIAIPGAATTGAYTASPSGIVFVSNLTGEINLAASTPGTYIITRSDSSTLCPSTVTFSLTITNNPSAQHSFSSGVYCQNALFANPVFTAGGSAGTFTFSPTGLVFIDQSTGEIDLIGSTPGTYQITNTINAPGCPVATDTSTITIANQSIDAGAALSTCTGNGANLLGVAIGPNSNNVTWSGGTGSYFNINNDSTLYTPSLADANFGVVSLTLTMNGTANCPTISDNVLLSIQQGAISEAGNNLNVCDGGGAPIILNGSVSGLATSGNWSTNGSGSFGNAAALNTVYTPSSGDLSNGSVVIYLTSDDPIGNCLPAIDSIVVSFSTQPTISMQINGTTFCANASINLTASSTGTVSNYQWSTIPVVPGSTAGTFSAINASTTTYTPSADDIANGSVIFNVNGVAPAPCSSVNTMDTIQLLPAPTAVISGGGVIQTGTGTICPNGTTAPVNIVINGNGPFSITYAVGNDTTTLNNITSPLVYPDGTPGPFNLIALSDLGSCPGTITGSASVDTVNIRFTSFFVSETCGENDGIAYINNISGGSQPYTYLWNNSTASTLDSISNLGTGLYTIAVADANNCVSTSTINVPQVLGIVASITADPMSGSYPLTVNFTNNSTGASNYLWSFGDSDTSAALSPSHIFELQGTYQVVLTAYNTPGCSISDSLTIFVDGEVANIFTPNGDGSNDKFSFNKLSVKSFNAQIFNRWGKKVYEWSDPKDGWDGSNAQSGVYYYIVQITNLNDKEEELHGTITLLK